MSSFNDFLNAANSWAVWAADMCDYFEDEHDGCCKDCPCIKIDNDDGGCLLNLSNWLKDVKYNDWAQKIIEEADYLHKSDTDWEAERRQLMETCDRLAAENGQLNEEIESMKKAALENQVLRTRLTQETLSNLEMKIALDLQELYQEERERNADICQQNAMPGQH